MTLTLSFPGTKAIKSVDWLMPLAAGDRRQCSSALPTGKCADHLGLDKCRIRITYNHHGAIGWAKPLMVKFFYFCDGHLLQGGDRYLGRQFVVWMTRWKNGPSKRNLCLGLGIASQICPSAKS